MQHENRAWCSSCKQEITQDEAHFDLTECSFEGYTLDYDPKLSYRQRHPEEFEEREPGVFYYIGVPGRQG